MLKLCKTLIRGGSNRKILPKTMLSSLMLSNGTKMAHRVKLAGLGLSAALVSASFFNLDLIPKIQHQKVMFRGRNTNQGSEGHRNPSYEILPKNFDLKVQGRILDVIDHKGRVVTNGVLLDSTHVLVHSLNQDFLKEIKKGLFKLNPSSTFKREYKQNPAGLRYEVKTVLPFEGLVILKLKKVSKKNNFQNFTKI